MNATQLRKLESELWKAADQLRANSKLTASEYSMPVLGLIFLRHAYNRFLKVKVEIEKSLPSHPQRGIRPLTKQDFEKKNAMFLPEKAQFQYLVNLEESKDIGEELDNAMRLIEEEYESLNGVLPKNFSIFSKDLLKELLRIFNKEVLQQADGDIFGKIYEYFLNKFAMTGAQEGGEFFTPMSLVQTIVNVIEPESGIILDPATGSAGMFVQTGYFLENQGLKEVSKKVTFYGQEKADVNTKIAKMNMAVHGLEAFIAQGNTFYEDKHELVGKCDRIMANPPFNVDGVDKAKEVVKKDPRLVLDGKVQLPKNDNANYLWILYFYNYLKPTGRAGFVMASSASDAGHSEKEIREKLVKTGAVDVMFAIGNNFFYTRSLPCTLWFFDRSKESDKKKSDLVLMLDARKIYRKVTSKVNDFSPEQLQNLICIVNLYRGNKDKFEKTVKDYYQKSHDLAQETSDAIQNLQKQFQITMKKVEGFAVNFAKENKEGKAFVDSLKITEITEVVEQQNKLVSEIKKVKPESKSLEAIAHLCKGLRKPQDKLLKQFLDAINTAVKDFQLNKNRDWKDINLKADIDQLKNTLEALSGNPEEENFGLLHDTEYFWKQAHWLTSRFPKGVYTDVEGLCKVVTQKEIEAKDWSLSPGRYVGVDTSTDEEFDYEERLHEIHIELEGLNEEAVALAKSISNNFNELAI
ncbi:type I restriction-modification system subunit M [Leptospira levettii]|uniref:type I restriction-modification system subunit M n=1 Tax=Leptospira levettii TaxID=2023178 RepID=UPI00223DBEF1|nr:class I SAM-dependent DNA methyltransferase [Leptospira levettii]MCW7498460.1 type I restriction-modification system subunit M [Leptospira levettii]